MRNRVSFADTPVEPGRLPSFRAEYFPDSGPYPWLDRPGASEEIERRLRDGRITCDQAALCRKWATDGYIILPNLFDSETLDAVWDGYEAAISAGKIVLAPEPAGEGDPFPGRFLNPHRKVGAFCRILKHPGLLGAIELLMEHRPKPLQTITSHKGSQQAPHSDSIHMTTYPLGYLTAAWIACEDIHPDSGPLVYYPGSHRLPYVFSREAGIAEEEFRQNGYTAYQERYEPFIRRLVETRRIEPHYFHARKGDVLIWHANLVHGGSMRKDLRHSRRAIVCHFFVKGVFVYHDLAAARSRQRYMGTCLLRDQDGAIRVPSPRSLVDEWF